MKIAFPGDNGIINKRMLHLDMCVIISMLNSTINLTFISQKLSGFSLDLV